MAPSRNSPATPETPSLIKGFELVMLQQLEKDQEAHTRHFKQEIAELKAEHEQQMANLKQKHENAWKDNVSRRKTETRKHWERHVDALIESHKDKLVPAFARADNTTSNGTPMSNDIGAPTTKATSAAMGPPAAAVPNLAASATPFQTLPQNNGTIVAADTRNVTTGCLKRASDTNTDEGPAKRRSRSDPRLSVATGGPSLLSQYETRSDGSPAVKVTPQTPTPPFVGSDSCSSSTLPPPAQTDPEPGIKTSTDHGSIEDSGPSKHDRDVAYLHEAWGGHGWFPHGFLPSTHRLADRLNSNDTQYLRGITRLALHHKVDLPSLYQPGGALYDAMAGSVGVTPVWTATTVKIARALLHKRVLGRTSFGSGAGPIAGGEGASTPATPVAGLAAGHDDEKGNLDLL